MRDNQQPWLQPLTAYKSHACVVCVWDYVRWQRGVLGRQKASGVSWFVWVRCRPQAVEEWMILSTYLSSRFFFFTSLLLFFLFTNLCHLHLSLSSSSFALRKKKKTGCGSLTVLFCIPHTDIYLERERTWMERTDGQVGVQQAVRGAAVHGLCIKNILTFFLWLYIRINTPFFMRSFNFFLLFKINENGQY